MKLFYLALAVAILAVQASAEPVSITPAQIWPAADGNHIDAHCGDILKVGDTFYWFGESRQGPRVQNISCYTSKDLSHWTFDKYVITPKTDLAVAQSHFERPKVVYNDKTHQFVMWLHRESLAGYADAQCAVATCETADGNYSWHGAFRPNGNMSRDSTLFKDDNGDAYFISSSDENADMMVYKLTDDYLKVQSQVALLFRGRYREAPCLFKRNGIYYLVTSFCTGTAPNFNCYSTATSMNGPWSDLKHLCGNDTVNTFYTQAAFILTVQGTATTSYIYCADRWQVMPMRHVWLPLQFAADGSIEPMQWADSWTIDATTGQATYPEEFKPLPGDLAHGAVATSDYNQKGVMDETNFTHLAGCEPSNATDGDLTTWWCARDNLPGHWWEVDLGAANNITGTQIIWHRQNGTYHYAIDVSPDDQHWTRKITAVGKSNGRNGRQPTANDSFSADGARYVRVTILSTPSGYDWPGFAECKVLNNGTDIAHGKPATADSWQANTDPAKAIDGDTGTAWSIDDRTPGHWIKIDLGKTVGIGACRILWDAPGFYHQYKIETSADDKQWTTAVDMTTNTAPIRMPLHKFDAPRARYLRLTVTGAERRCWPAIRDLEILPADSGARAEASQPTAPMIR
jgi:Glycosyl hydrolases family 43/F5/8 type C domain